MRAEKWNVGGACPARAMKWFLTTPHERECHATQNTTDGFPHMRWQLKKTPDPFLASEVLTSCISLHLEGLCSVCFCRPLGLC